MLYWHNLEPDDYSLVRGGAAVGEYSLCLKKGFVMSAPFVAQRGEPFTLSFFVRGDRPGVVDVSMPPSAREVGTKADRLWTRGAGQTAKFGTNWQRVSFTWTADVPPDGFWPYPHYLVQIGGGNTSLPIYIDGVTVTPGREGTTTYVPRREIEVLAECPDLPGYAGAKANLFERGASPRVTAHVSNPVRETRTVTVRWQLFDYEDERSIGEAVEKKLTLAPGQTISETVPLKLSAVGMVLARVSVLDARLSTLDSSELPLTSLPYPKSASKPDWRERFGGSFAGGLGCVEKHQRLGFGWIRWRPHSNGEDHLPKEPAEVKDATTWQWKWFDPELDEQEAHGQSSHLVLYPPPKWIMEKDHPLPKDMRWSANDPRWDDLSVETVWDKFVRSAVTHYQGRSVIYEIENEPDFDHWDKLEETYARFTIRTARLIKHTDPKARVMVDNVYGIPSAVNAVFFKAGGLKFIDVMSWHDYHEGWLADAVSLRRMRQNMDEAGGKHVEIWFNEGWAFSNTAVDEPIACTHLTSAQSANAIVDCVAELTANGQAKTILFHTAYETHGMSFWDYSGPGTMLWDWYNYPLPLVAAWNVLAHHIGVSETAGFVRPPGANFCIFQDQRNHRGLMIAYADRESKADVSVDLPDFGTPLLTEDMMGNSAAAARKLVLSQTGRPVYLYAANGSVSGERFATELAPLDRKHASFVGKAGGLASSWRLPAAWEGVKKGSADGNPVSTAGRPIWRIDRVYPSEPNSVVNYAAVPWDGTTWHPTDHEQGGQPSARVESGVIYLGVSGPWQNNEFQKIAGLVFIAPQSARYRVRASASSKPWTGGAQSFRLAVLKKDTQRAAEVRSVVLPREGTPVPLDFEVELTAGHELVFLPLMPDWNNATTTRIDNLVIEQEP